MAPRSDITLEALKEAVAGLRHAAKEAGRVRLKAQRSVASRFTAFTKGIGECPTKGDIELVRLAVEHEEQLRHLQKSIASMLLKR